MFQAMRFVANSNLNSAAGAVSKLVLVLIFVTPVIGQDLFVRITLTPDRRAQVSGSFSQSLAQRIGDRLHFLDSYAGISGLANRRSNLQLLSGTSQFSYTIDLKPLANQTAAAHVSWMTADNGLLMLDDMIPQVNARTAEVKLEVPDDWRIDTTETGNGVNVFHVADVEKAAFVLGKNRRQKLVRIGDVSLRFSMSGDWQFAEEDIGQTSSEIFSQYREIFGDAPARDFLIAYYPFPIKVASGNWEADTRGSTSVIVSSDMPFASQSPQRLHEQLRHEIFHFWMPNGVNLRGGYDWFYEGFALYTSAKVGVATNTIRFEGFLDVLSRAHAIDARSQRELSLVDSSRNRFAGANSQLYARGMVVAFLCDLAMLEKSRGKRSTADLLSKVYQKHRNLREPVDGNAAILETMAQWPELGPIAERFIEGGEPIDWASYLAHAGLTAVNSELKVSEKLSGRQKNLLDKLGYNSWRKLLVK